MARGVSGKGLLGPRLNHSRCSVQPSEAPAWTTPLTSPTCSPETTDLANILFERLERGEGYRQVLVDQMILNVAVHAGGEEQVFYPAQTEAGWSDVVDSNLVAHQVVKDALAVLDRHDLGTPEAEAAVAEVIATVRAHAADEELDELSQLRAEVGDARMLELGRAFMAAQAKTPTRSHPHAPSNPIVAAPAAFLDKLRDTSGKRDAVTATDASGLLDAQTQELVDSSPDSA